MSSSQRDTRRIERDVEETRSRLSSRLDALQGKLEPRQAMDEAFRYLRSSGTSDFGRNLMSDVRDNPLPVALVGLGLGWLVWRNGQGRPDYAASGTSLGDVASSVRGSTHRADERPRYRADSTASHLHDEGRGRVGAAGDRARHAGEGVVSYFQEQPLLLAAAGVTLGAVFASLIPPSRQEQEMAGRLRQGAEQALEGTTERAKGVAGAMAEAGQSEMRRDSGRGSSDRMETTGAEQRSATAEPNYPVGATT